MRCGGKRTKQEVDGVPTCDDCRAQLEIAREASRACPVDGNVMTKAVIHNVVVDRCPECNGVWLDGGELEIIQATTAEHGDFASGFVLGMVT
jgi:hypothetical protein